MYFLISCSWKLFLEKMSNTKKISTYAALLLFFSLQKIFKVKLSKQKDAKSSFFLQNQARTIQTHKTVFENSFLAMFISQVSSKLRDKHCQITWISILIFKHCFMGQYIESVVMLPCSVKHIETICLQRAYIFLRFDQMISLLNWWTLQN